MSFDIAKAAQLAKQSKGAIANLNPQNRLKLLQTIASELIANSEAIITENQKDLALAKETGLSASMVDRLGLDQKGIEAIASAVLNIAAQPDVLGSIENMHALPSGIEVGKMRIPLGVIAMIYESRPNVTIDAAVLCLKAGNAVILRGGKEAQYSNQALANVLHDALNKCGLPSDIVTVIPTPDREVMNTMLTLSQDIDLVIPRGGEGLIRHVTQHSQIPVIQHFKGVCHLFVEASADEQKALAILENGKTQRTGVCNALETLLVDTSIADSFLPKVAELFKHKQVKVHACAQTQAYFDDAELATEDDWHAEYLALEIAVKLVNGFDKAVEHITQYGSGHTEVIVTEQHGLAQRFLREVNSSVVMVNASSRFSDGGELGLGAEIGISTSKLHAYGPMGAQSLTTQKFIVMGDGHVRS
jgi:glutamate-5-semialdehyde dehydrogenase